MPQRLAGRRLSTGRWTSSPMRRGIAFLLSNALLHAAEAAYCTTCDVLLCRGCRGTCACPKPEKTTTLAAADLVGGEDAGACALA